jgi:hypothetical protein
MESLLPLFHRDKILVVFYFIGSVGFGDPFSDSLFTSILFASAIFGRGCSAGAYQQIVKNMQ